VKGDYLKGGSGVSAISFGSVILDAVFESSGVESERQADTDNLGIRSFV